MTPSKFFETTVWEKKGHAIWLATTLTLYRNLSPYPFPCKMNAAQTQQTCQLIREHLCHEPSVFFDAKELTPLEKDRLFEHYLCPPSQGQGFILDSLFCAEVNGEDHLKMHLIDLRENPLVAWNTLNQMETSLAAKNGFAFHPQFGFLTSTIDHCGTGLEIKAYLHVPALIHSGKIPPPPEGIQFSSLSGTEYTADLLIISNASTLGSSEESLIQNVSSAASKIAAQEKALRTQDDSALRDKISRALGLLLFSYQLKTKETLNALSQIKLGKELGWIQGIDDEVLNRLFFYSQKGHLLHHLKQEMTDPAQIARKRAEFLHHSLQGAKMVEQ